MATWTDIIARLLVDLTDPNGVFHQGEDLRTYGEQAELCLTMRRALYERTRPLTFIPNTALYVTHAFFPDFIRPLRVTVGGLALRWTSLAAVGRLHRDWMKEPGDPESVFMVGKTILGFYPAPDVPSCQITYLATPPTRFSAPAAGASPIIDPKWHETLGYYMQAVALGKEGEYQRAATSLKEFLALAGVERDERFLEGLSQRTAQSKTRQVERMAHD
jgi:hypothetical protein